MKASSLLALAGSLVISINSVPAVFSATNDKITGSASEHVIVTPDGSVTEKTQKSTTGKSETVTTRSEFTTKSETVTSQSETIKNETTVEQVSKVKKRPRVGLALGGGGARGAAHVGVMKVLLEEGIPIDLIAGTSIGSVVGGLYAAGFSVDDLAEKFDDSELMRNFMPVGIKVRIAVAPIMFLPRLVGYHPYDGLYRGVKFRKYANRLAGENTEISKLSIPFAAVVTDLVDGNSHRLTEGNLGEALQASTAVPGLRKPVQIGDHLYCDGGLINNLPVNHVREMGADFIIAVNIDEDLEEVPLKTFRKAGSVSTQALKIQLYNIDKKANETADLTIHPNTNGISLISAHKKDGNRGLLAGVEAARKAMPELKRKLAEIGITPTKMVKAN
jgi:NTE family protein